MAHRRNAGSGSDTDTDGDDDVIMLPTSSSSSSSAAAAAAAASSSSSSKKRPAPDPSSSSSSATAAKRARRTAAHHRQDDDGEDEEEEEEDEDEYEYEDDDDFEDEDEFEDDDEFDEEDEFDEDEEESEEDEFDEELDDDDDEEEEEEEDDVVLVVSMSGPRKRKLLDDDDEDEDEDDEDEAADRVCLCGGADNELMIGCDTCGRWLHLFCAGLEADSLELGAPMYRCPLCLDDVKPNRPKRRKENPREDGPPKRNPPRPNISLTREGLALRKKLKAMKVVQLRPLLREYGEMQAATDKKADMIDKLVALRYTLPTPEAMKLVMGSSHLASIILQFVAAGDLFRCAFVSCVWRKAACHPLQWQKFLERGRRPPIDIYFPLSTSVLDRAKALAQVYFNLYEPGLICPKCRVVPISREKLFGDVGWLQSNIRVVTSTHMFGVDGCPRCNRWVTGSKTQSQYRVRAAESTLRCKRRRKRTTVYRYYKRRDVLRLACTTYGGQSNLTAFIDYRTRGSSASRPLIDYMVRAKEETARWEYDRVPELMPVTAEDAHQVFASARRTQLIAVVDELIQNDRIRDERQAAAHQLAVEQGSLACLHEGCAKTFHLSDRDFFSRGGEPNCKHVLCMDHCKDKCVFHTKHRAELKRRAACAQAQAVMSELLAKVIARDDVSQQRASLLAVPDLLKSRHSRGAIEKVTLSGHNCFMCLKAACSDHCVYCAQCCKDDSRVDTVEQGCKLHHEAELAALAAFNASAPDIPVKVHHVLKDRTLIKKMPRFLANRNAYCAKCVSGEGHQTGGVPWFRKLPEESLGKCDYCAACCLMGQRWQQLPVCDTHSVHVPNQRNLSGLCDGRGSCSNTPAANCAFAMCGGCCPRKGCPRHGPRTKQKKQKKQKKRRKKQVQKKG